MTKAILPLTFLLIFSSCFTSNNAMKAWIGDTKRNLILKMGPPAKVTSDGANGEILIYADQTYFNHNKYYEYKMFYSDSTGKIYHSRKDKRNLPPSQIQGCF